MTTDINSISTLFYKDQPLGPEKISEIRQIPELIFSDTLPHKRLLQKPTIIVGRRGSGKSSILSTYYTEGKYDKDLIMAVPQNIAMSKIVKLINEVVSDEIFVENITPVWEFVLLSCYSSCFYTYLSNLPIQSKNQHHTDALQKISSFLSELKISNEMSIEEQIVKLCNFLNSQRDLIAFILSAKIGELSLSEIRNLIDSILSEAGERGIILIDSLEEMRLDIDEMYPALGGFLRTFDSIQRPGSRLDLICNIPAEVYFPLYEEISTAPIKDFNKSQALHWSASELIQICAYRLSVYLRISDNPDVTRWIDGFDFSKKSDAKLLFAQVLPSTLVNGANIQEDTLAYIIRHTQLLPRHLIIIFNEIFHGLTPLEIMQREVDRDRIVGAIKEKEVLISTDIINGYNNRYHGLSWYNMFSHVKQICDTALKELDLEFGYEDIAQVYKRNIRDSIPYVFDVNDILRVLIEVGAIGIKIKTNSSLYRNGLFEYTATHKLVFKTTDQFLIHPCFVEQFCSIQVKQSVDFAIYPHGTSFDDDNYRI